MFLAAYAAALVLLLPRLSLWLDEILTLIGALKPDLASLFSYLRINPGATPLGFLIPSAILKVAGYSVAAARIPSVVFSLAACAGTFVLAAKGGLRTPLVAVLLLAACPLQFRYAMEARPYAIALAISVWLSVVLLAMLDRPRSWVLAGVYVVLSIAGAYTIAFTLFVPAAHALWLAQSRKNTRVLAIAAAAMVVSALALVPFYLYVREGWSAGQAAQRLTATIGWRSAELILHELTGAGYPGTIVLIAGAIWGVRHATDRFWIFCAVVPIALVLVGDFVFGYFLAIRQMIYVLPPLLLLFVRGSEAMGRYRFVPAALLLAVFLYADVHWLAKPREDWHAAANAAASIDACVQFAPADAAQLYTFFHPELSAKRCTGDSVVLATSPYDPDAAVAAAERSLESRGFTRESKQEFTGPAIEKYSRK